MKNHKILFVLFAAVTVIVSSCSKSSPTVVGNWQLSNLVGSQTYVSVNPAGNDTTTYSLSYTATSNGGVITSVKTELPGAPQPSAYTYSLNLNIQSGGVVTTNEVYVGSSDSTLASTGNWYYLSSNTSNNAILLNIPWSYLTSNLAMGNTFTVASVSSSQMQLTANTVSTITSGIGQEINSSLTLTFTK